VVLVQANERMERRGGWQNRVTPDLAAFLAERDSFYFGTASRDGQPYIQHRGGPNGFLKVVDERNLGFADFAGNAQYISVGNLDENNKAFIFLMDYPNRRRIKIWGTAEIVEDDSRLLQTLSDADYEGRPERAVLLHIKAWDVNCPQHILPRWWEAESAPVIESLRSRIVELERENQQLRSRVDGIQHRDVQSRTVPRPAVACHSPGGICCWRPERPYISFDVFEGCPRGRSNCGDG
jgi:predicted pyridoxine 5'-phosphate oxidase superfamily flavin-nucleotide-binding protein